MNNSAFVERKPLSISSKRQITIPQKFYDMLGFENEAECYVRGNELVIRPRRDVSGGELDEQILADLISQGYSGTELLNKFKEARRKVPEAVQAMIKAARDAAHGIGEFYTLEEVFGENNGDE